MFYRENVYLAGAKAEGNRSDRFHWPATFGNRKQMSTRYRNLADYKSRERERWREGGMGFFAMGRNDRSFRVLGGGEDWRFRSGLIVKQPNRILSLEFDKRMAGIAVIT